MTMPILWTSTRTSGTIVHCMAAVSGLPIDVRFISLRKGEHKTPDYLAINPKGEVAALQIPDHGTTITEIPAMALWLRKQRRSPACCRAMRSAAGEGHGVAVLVPFPHGQHLLPGLPGAAHRRRR